MPASMKGREKGSFYREAPFWSWNGVLDAAEARRQIDEMAAGGWGGFFMHARPGLVTQYMGKKWMEVVKASVAHAKKLKMCAYLYDENRWPSGFAGGAVPKKGAKYRGKWLILSENLLEKGPRFKPIASFRLDSGGKAVRLPQDCAADTGKGTGATYHLYQYTMGLGDAWFQGACYVDLLDPDVTREFIAQTHEKYKAAVGKDFGKTIPAIFTDEPSLPRLSSSPWPALPWTPSLPRVFKDRRGYDIIPHVLSLFLPCGDFHKTRYDFYRTVTEMFVEGYMKQLYEWCEENSLALTGHMLAEDRISGQTRWTGAAMPHYEYMHIPGMDHLDRNIENPTTAKQVSSVADQLGKKRVLSELYGCSGQDFNLKGRKWIADWHLALGINLLNPHLWLYSMQGRRKRDFPPTISFQQPHWRKSKTLSDRNATLSYLLSRGRRIVDVLVVHPVESAWCVNTPLDEAAVEKLDKPFAALVDTLLAGHIDFHFGDESLLAKYGSVDGAAFKVGQARYGVVVVPECLTLRYETARLLGEFSAAGGKVIVVGRRPALVDGSRSGTAILRKALAVVPVVKLADLVQSVRSVSAAPVEITGRNASKVLYHLRDIGAEEVLFVANTDYDKGARAEVSLAGKAKFAGRLDLSSGDISTVAARRAKGRLNFTVDLAEAESALFVIGRKPYHTPKKPPCPAKRSIALDSTWKVKKISENALTLDHVRIPSPSYGWTQPRYVLFARDDLEAAGTVARARYEFEVERVPKGPVYIALERAESWTMLFNGASVAPQCKPGEVSYFVDKAFRRVDVTGLVRRGHNVLEVRSRIGRDFELESAYVVGRFGVSRRGEGFVVGAPPKEVRLEDITAGGLPFFAGVVDLEKEVVLARKPASAKLALNQLRAGAADVIVNGRLQGEFLYPPYEVELKGLRKGKNRLVLRLYSTLRNLLGPHHFEGPELSWVSPGSFVDRKRWSDEYRFQTFGAEGISLHIG